MMLAHKACIINNILLTSLPSKAFDHCNFNTIGWNQLQLNVACTIKDIFTAQKRIEVDWPAFGGLKYSKFMKNNFPVPMLSSHV